MNAQTAAERAVKRGGHILGRYQIGNRQTGGASAGETLPGLADYMRRTELTREHVQNGYQLHNTCFGRPPGGRPKQNRLIFSENK